MENETDYSYSFDEVEEKNWLGKKYDWFKKLPLMKKILVIVGLIVFSLLIILGVIFLGTRIFLKIHRENEEDLVESEKDTNEDLLSYIDDDRDCNSGNSSTADCLVDDEENVVLAPTDNSEDNNLVPIEHDIPGHLRNLPDGQHPSQEKIDEAEENGITLSPEGNVTYVSDYQQVYWMNEEDEAV